MNNKITHTNSHGLIDTPKMRNEWLDELEKDAEKEAKKSGSISHGLGTIKRLISMARKAEEADKNIVELLDKIHDTDSIHNANSAKVERYEKALKKIRGMMDGILAQQIASEALDEGKE